MSKFSETTIPHPDSFLAHLGYPDGRFANTYYTAQVRPGLGVCVCKLISRYYVQFFPWDQGPLTTQDDHGHGRYAKYITQKVARDTKSFPFGECPGDADILTIKCIIEEGLKQCEQSNA